MDLVLALVACFVCYVFYLVVTRRLCFNKREKTPDFKWFYFPPHLDTWMERNKKYVYFYWWFGYEWAVTLLK